MLKPNDLLFVYGTLRKRGPFHGHLKGAIFLGDATIAGSMYMLDGHAIPFVMLDNAGRVRGEIYMLPSAEICEGIMRLEKGYECKRVPTAYLDGLVVNAYVFFTPRDMGGWCERVASGDYMRRDASC